ncbi:MAG: ribulose-phosphate 3-epimerase [Candidatus Omnitrophica bacterium]|nr:ribulose-phosphate 3-epimerase [Candidatus Omnitrophota bacterium]
MAAALPYTTEIHLKNTDSLYNSTFGFTDAERERGIIDIEKTRDFYLAHSKSLPVSNLIGYLEIGGPKLGRDYSDCRLEKSLRESLRYLKETFVSGTSDHPETIKAPVEIVSRNGSDRAVVQIAPSMMCADQLHFEESVRRMEAHRADLLHIDIMDAGFAPNMPLGFEVVKALRPITDLPIDVHLMVEDNDFFVGQFAEIGVDLISVHAESCVHLDRTLSHIRSHGIKAGVALNPHTPLSALDHVLEKLDFILLMTVNPGYAGQKLVPSTLRKIADCKTLLEDHGRDIPIEVDGNVSFENIPKMVAAGADILVAGTSSVFSSKNSLGENFMKTRAAIEIGLEGRESNLVEEVRSS